MNREELLEKSLEYFIYLQLIAECTDVLPSDIKRKKIKFLSNQLIKEIEPIINKAYNRMFFTDEEVTVAISKEIENCVKIWSEGRLDRRIFISQAQQAHSLNPTEAEKQIHKILINEPQEEI